MHRVRASSYLRRTISEPFYRKKSLLAGNTGFAKESTIPLVDKESTEEKPSTLSAYTWSSDLAGLLILLSSRLNILLLFIPLGAMANYLGWGDFAIFWLNFVALIPLAAILGNATEELALHTGDMLGGLLNATFGNAVEMIVVVQALRAGLIDIVQGSLLGSILSNLLLVLGMSFFLGGVFNHVQTFNARGATCSTSLLLLSSLGFIMPTIVSQSNESIGKANILTISRLTALLISMTYCLFLFFQLGTHFKLFKEQEPIESTYSNGGDEAGNLVDSVWPNISASSAVALLLVTTLSVSFTSDALVASIDGLSKNSGISKGFIGVILLPIIGNASEHATAVIVAIKNKPDLTLAVAIGSSIQIAMFMVPFAVLVGWALGVPMTLAFSQVSGTVLTFSILIVIGIVQDGESNWLEGVMLMIAYCIIAIVYWFN